MSFVTQVKVIVWALSMLGARYQKRNFNCRDFVHCVYRKSEVVHGKEIVRYKTIQDIPVACVILLAKKGYEGKWSHMAIKLPCGFAIHNSYFYGKKVVISRIGTLLDDYDLVT